MNQKKAGRFWNVLFCILDTMYSSLLFKYYSHFSHGFLKYIIVLFIFILMAVVHRRSQRKRASHRKICQGLRAGTPRYMGEGVGEEASENRSV